MKDGPKQNDGLFRNFTTQFLMISFPHLLFRLSSMFIQSLTFNLEIIE